MSHELLHNLELRTSSAKQCEVCSAEGVPSNPLRYAQFLRDRLDVMTKKLLSPILWSLSAAHRLTSLRVFPR
jgi:hypothetical protein